MNGMRFLIVGQDGPLNHGVIAQTITAEKYLCRFARIPTSCRVCGIEEIQGWNLFPTDEEMNAFIANLAKEDALLTNGQNVKSVNQTGGVTAGVVNVDPMDKLDMGEGAVDVEKT